MKKLVIFLFIVVGFFSFGQMAVADQIRLISPSIYSVGGAGEFTMQAIGTTLLDYISSYDSRTKNVNGTSSTFQTFCIEHYEYINWGGLYDAVLNNRAISGGSDLGEPAIPGDPISKGTAYLYYQFATGALSGYFYSGTPTPDQRKASAADLQNAIWYLEDEGGANNSFVAAAITRFGSLAAAKAENNGEYGVMVLNLYAEGHARDPLYLKQDQLILTPVPEPFTMLLLGVGLIGVAGIRRKL